MKKILIICAAAALTGCGSPPQTDLCCRVQTSVSGTVSITSTGSGVSSGAGSSPTMVRQPDSDSAAASSSISRIRRFIGAAPPFLSPKGYYSKRSSGVQRAPELVGVFILRIPRPSSPAGHGP